MLHVSVPHLTDCEVRVFAKVRVSPNLLSFGYRAVAMANAAVPSARIPEDSHVYTCGHIASNGLVFGGHRDDNMDVGELVRRLQSRDLSIERVVLRRIHEKWFPQLLQALPLNAQVHTIDLKWNKFSRRDAQRCGQAIGAHPTVQTLRIAKCRYQRGSSLADLLHGIQASPSLQCIYLWQCDWEKSSVQALCGVIRNLRTLRFLCLVNKAAGDHRTEDHGKSTDLLIPVFQELANNTSVRTLRVREPRQREVSDSPESQSSLSYLWAIVQMLRRNSTLRELDLENACIGDCGVLAMSNVLGRHNNTTLQALDLKYNAFGREGACALGRLLTVNTTLKRISLKSNHLANSLDPLLTPLHCHNTTVVSILLDDNRLSEDDGKRLAQMLLHNDTILDLQLCDNHIGDSGVAALAEALTVNTRLRVLGLNRNGITPVGFQSLGQALPRISALRVLSLSGNQSDLAGEATLTQGLATNTSLHHVSVSLFQSTLIAYYARLNQAGRCILQHDGVVPTGVWPILLGRSSATPDALYYFLREKPELLCGASCR